MKSCLFPFPFLSSLLSPHTFHHHLAALRTLSLLHLMRLNKLKTRMSLSQPKAWQAWLQKGSLGDPGTGSLSGGSLLLSVSWPLVQSGEHTLKKLQENKPLSSPWRMLDVTVGTNKCLIYWLFAINAKPCAKHLCALSSFICHHCLVRWALSSLFCKWGQWSSERSRNLSKITQPATGTAETGTRIFFTANHVPLLNTRL